MNIVYRIFRISFFVFLGVSGILLGIFLIMLGSAMILGLEVAGWIGWVVLILGICAFLLHVGHYFSLRYMRWTFGEDYFVQKIKK